MSYQTFKTAFAWNSLNIFAYKILLQTHQTLLFYVVGKELFGLSGTLFSSLYLMISLTNFGFDYSLFAFFRIYTASQKNMEQFFKQCIIRMIMLAASMIGILCIAYHLALPWIKLPSLFLVVIFCSIFISESLKKTAELFANFAFLNKAITIVEISMLCFYIATVWLWYAATAQANFFMIFIPMACMSWIELLLLFKPLYTWYQTLPKTAAIKPVPAKSIFANQAFNYINQITKALFSPNAMIVVLAYDLGIAKAGYIKLIVESIIALYMILHKAVGVPSAAIISSEITLSVKNQLSTFLKIINQYIRFLFFIAMLIAGIFLIHKILYPTTNDLMIINILLFVFAGFIEYLFLMYEKLFLTQNRYQALVCINLLSFGLIITIYFFGNFPYYLNIIHVIPLLPFILARIPSLLLIITKAHQIWGFCPNFSIFKKN